MNNRSLPMFLRSCYELRNSFNEKDLLGVLFVSFNVDNKNEVGEFWARFSYICPCDLLLKRPRVILPEVFYCKINKAKGGHSSHFPNIWLNPCVRGYGIGSFIMWRLFSYFTKELGKVLLVTGHLSHVDAQADEYGPDRNPIYVPDTWPPTIKRRRVVEERDRFWRRCLSPISPNREAIFASDNEGNGRIEGYLRDPSLEKGRRWPLWRELEPEYALEMAENLDKHMENPYQRPIPSNIRR